MIANEDCAPSNAELFVDLLHKWVKHPEVHKACKQLAGKKIKYITVAKDVPQERSSAAKSADAKSDDDKTEATVVSTSDVSDAAAAEEAEEESKSAVEPEFDSD